MAEVNPFAQFGRVDANPFAQFGPKLATDDNWDVAKSGAAGLVQGGLNFAGGAGATRELLSSGADYIADKLGIDPQTIKDYASKAALVSPTAGIIANAPTPGDLRSGLENLTGVRLHQPTTTAGQYAKTTGEFLGNPFSYMGAGGPVRSVAGAVTSALGSEAAGQLTQGTAFEPYARVGGAMMAGLSPAIVERGITPFPATAQRTADAAVLDAEHVPLTAGDRTGSRMLRATESELGPGVNEEQRRAFTAAAFRRGGEDIGDRPITGPGGAVDSMLNRTGTRFNTLQARNSVDMDQRLVSDLQNIHSTYNDVPGIFPRETREAANGAINRVLDAFTQSQLTRGGRFANPSQRTQGASGGMSGEDYQTLRSNLSAAARGALDPQRAEALHDVTEALDNAMERTIQRTNPGDAGAWAQARRNYRNALVLERWAGSQNMTPATLAQAAKAVYGKRTYVRGQDDFSDLAESGRRVLAQFPDSGTASRQNIEGFLRGATGAAGYALGARSGAPEGGVGGLLLGEGVGPFVARPIARAALMNPVTQRYLANQALPRAPANPMALRLARALAQTQ